MNDLTRICLRKTAYASKEAAAHDLAEMRRTGKVRWQAKVYPCPFGEHWHHGAKRGEGR